MSLTSQQIVTLACQIAKVPGFTSQAGQFLNSILSELCQTYDFEAAKGNYSFTFTAGASGPNNLPTDWLRANRDDVKYTISGVAYVMINIDNAEFDAQVQQAGLQAYPSMYTVVFDSTGANPPQMYVWVPPSGSFPVFCRYQRQMPDITTPEASSTIPWFPFPQYLIRRLAGEMMGLANDDRQAAYLGVDSPMGAQAMLDRYLKLQGDDEDRAKKVTLDRRLFTTNNSRLKNTKNIGW